MSSLKRRAELKALSEASDEARRIEQNRIDNLTMWERIYECKADESIKDILRILAERAGLE